MSVNNTSCWKTNPEYIKLMNFLIERSKDAKPSLNLRQLAEEFKENSGSSQEIGCLFGRILEFRTMIHQMDSIDTAAKVKLLFVLRVPIDTSYLKELQKDANVEIDENNRITKYIAKNGSLEFERDHSPSAKQKTQSNNTDDRNNDPEDTELIDFLIEKANDTKPPLTLGHLAEEFKENSGSSQGLHSLVDRIFSFHPKIRELDSIHTAAKVKMLFAMSAHIDNDFLKELRKDAHVEIDKNNRITKYTANDGRLELEGDHSHYAKVNQVWKPEKLRDKRRASLPKTPKSVKRPAANVSNTSKKAKVSSSAASMKSENRAPNDSSRVSESKTRESSNPEIHQLHQPKKQKKMGSEKSQKDSADGSMDPIPKTPESVKRPAAEIPNPSKRAKDSSSAASMKSENHAPNDSSRVPESRSRKLACEVSPQPPNPKVQQLHQPKKPKKLVSDKSQNDSADGSKDPITKTPKAVKTPPAEVSNPSKTAKDSSPARFMNTEENAPDDSSSVPESRTRESPNPETQQLRQPKEEDVPETPRVRTRQKALSSRNGGAPRASGGDIPQEKPIKTESEADDGYVSRIKFLETIRSLVLNLDMPILTTLQTRIEKKLRESSPDAMISNDEMSLAMELLVAKITSQSVSNPSENAESVRFSHFLCYLKTAILNSKLEGLKGLLEKINAKIKEPISKDKNIPVEEVASALHSILRATGF